MKYGVLIPAYEPDEKLLELVDRLLERELSCVVVDDGSVSEGARAVFSALKDKIIASGASGGLALLEHEFNCGKGRAIKTGLSHMYEQGFTAAVTADSDGQHSPKDIIRIAEEMEKRPETLILGMRDVSMMPARSRAGNTLTRRLFKLLYGIALKDTQTGLRGIPLGSEKIRDELLSLEGERYEYEMEMLIEAGNIFPGGMYELPIDTIYIDDNAGSHFHTIKDGSKVYKVLLKNLPGFLLASLLYFLLDYALFNGFYYLVFHYAVSATVSARIISGLFNYGMNRRIAFRKHGESYNLWNYVKLALVVLAINMLLMYLLVDVLGLPAFVMKIIVEALLYVLSFSVQQRLAVKR